jgi:flagellar biosynthetic protein FlhB
MEMAKRRMMEKVPTADVVVTNPSHYAVALQYSSGEMRAPRVVAKGSDELAAVIRELAREHRIPVVAAPPLARALYRSVELEQEIPANLYAAVARVLSYVYQLRAWRGGTRPPQEPVIEAVPGGEPDPQ